MVATGEGKPTVKFDYVEWDDDDEPHGNVVHIEAAGLTPEEVEEVLGGPGPETISRAEPHRPAKFGWTGSGKYLFVAFERSEEAGIVVVYPVTAYEVDPP
jgi:hypothetical protein